ncbi:MAG: hypothetical protein IPJ41_11955 [Phycisphaerales bacterium]|nr:hypothetical protein [Phycisphaerales bacterium]
MEGASRQTLILSDGGLPALVAAAIEAERSLAEGGGGAMLLPWASLPAAQAEQQAAAHAQARFFRFQVLEDVSPTPIPSRAHGASQTMLLVAAAEAASRHGCERVVWPLQFHSDHETIGRHIEAIAGAVDRAQLVGRLAMLDTPPGAEAVPVEVPLVDLTDAQLADLVVDLDAPAYLAWWWRRLSDPGAELAAEQERGPWLAALRNAGWIRQEPSPAVARAEPALAADQVPTGTHAAGV